MAALLALAASVPLLRSWQLPGSTALPDARPEAEPARLSQREPLVIMTRAGERAFMVELALTPEQQATGLMFRTELADNAGMLFVHDEPHELSMWMKNTYIPLDMLFISRDGAVSRIATMTTPLSEEVIASGGDVVAVLELAGGAAARLNIAPGDKVLSRALGTAAN